MKRRHFIQKTALASAGAVIYACGGKPSTSTVAESQLGVSKSIGLQLYTLRDKLRMDNEGTSYFDRNEIKGIMGSVAEVGFEELECFDYKNGSIFDIPYMEFDTMIRDMGMKITSGHYGLGVGLPDKPSTVINGWQAAVEDANRIGQESMVVASLEKSERKSIDDYKKACELLNIANETCKSAGIKLQYHNHEFEFETLEGQIPYDVMLSELDTSIPMEMDLYWINYAGKDPFAYFAKYPGRFEQWHVKDMNKNNPKLQTDVGAGSIDFKAIFAKAELAGMKHYYLEQENYDVSPMDSITKGYAYLKAL
ncbi:MAG TPA: sugar phosphate isomerase/epimerase [Cyclobacteriaceae bacterium]